MAEGAQEERWNHTACLRADILAPWSKKRVNPMDLHPFNRRRKKAAPIKPDPNGVAMLTAALCGEHTWARPAKAES